MRIQKAKEGDTITLQRQNVEVEKCKKCGDLMVNIDADELRQGDLMILKKRRIKVSNPETEDLICVSCEYSKEPKKSFGSRISTWFDTSDDDDDDSGFFSGKSSGGGGFFGGSGFGGFGGFGGGSFGGGGASRGF